VLAPSQDAEFLTLNGLNMLDLSFTGFNHAAMGIKSKLSVWNSMVLSTVIGSDGNQRHGPEIIAKAAISMASARLAHNTLVKGE